MKIVADNTIPFLKGIAEPIAEVVYLAAKGFTRESIQDADVLIVRSIDKCTPELLEGSHVQLITTATIGFDHIDTRYCDTHGIAWRNAPGCNAPSVAQYVISSLITIALRRGESLRGKCLGIIGVGHVGSQVERMARLFGMNILRNDPPRAEVEGADGFVSLSELLAKADVVTLHVPFTREGNHPTYHLANDRFFQQMKKGMWFINSCRGAVHDTEALLQAHENGIVKEMIIDCWENEPQIDARLLEASSLASPHIAGFSADGKATATRMCLEAIEEHFKLHFEEKAQAAPPVLNDPVIDLDTFADHRVERAFLATFQPEQIDGKLRNDISAFEYLRNHYDRPREPKAYCIRHAATNEAAVLHAIGFQIEQDRSEK